MRPKQLRFWPEVQPLVTRLGCEFFRQLPMQPGVYLMVDRAGVVLYVGKARNLRQRLGYYRAANPDRAPRRTLRLLRLVESIEVRLFDEASIPWNDIAFTVIEKTLRHYLADRPSGRFDFRIDKIDPPKPDFS